MKPMEKYVIDTLSRECFLKKEQGSLLHANKLLASYYVSQLSKILIPYKFLSE